jgi:NAD(P)-dependent dehydrogenase (short-subunit alcohol dehydrogenase family)
VITLDLSGRVALVTGSSSGVGRAVARRLAAQGAAVVCADLGPSPAARGYEPDLDVDTHTAIEQAGGRSLFVATDVCSVVAAREAVAAAVDAFGRLDVLVNNAGIAAWGYLAAESEEMHDRILAVNVKGVWACCKAAIDRFLEQGEGGRIVNIASVGGLVGLPGQPTYSASKGAVVNLSRQIAIDYAADRIACNAVCPGALQTALMRDLLEDAASHAALAAVTPWPRLGTPDDVAAFVGFLATDHAEWITGAALAIDGGYSAH